MKRVESAAAARTVLRAWAFWWRDVMLDWIPHRWLTASRLFAARVWLIPDDGRFQVGLQSTPRAPCRALGSIRADQHPRDAIGAEAMGRSDWVLAIPAAQAIVKELTFPAAVRHRLRDVLHFELDRHTPFSSDHALFGFEELPAAAAGTVAVRVAAVPRRRVQGWLDLLAQKGITPRETLVFSDSGGTDAISLDRRSAAMSRSSRGTRLALLLAALLILAIALVPLVSKRAVVKELHQHHAAIFPEAQALAALDREREHLLQTLREPVDQRTNRVPVVKLLRDLTETIPDEGYLHSLRLDQDELRIEGETESATALIELLEALPSLSEVRFLSPTSRVQHNRERFQIGARIVSLSETAP